jgi:hypothetical protein
VKEGERVSFCRINYARWLDLADRTKIGWISEADIFGVEATPDPEVSPEEPPADAP